MSSVNEYWQSKTDEQILEAAQEIDKYTADGQARIRAEISSRGLDLEGPSAKSRDTRSADARRGSAYSTPHTHVLSKRYKDAYAHAAITVGVSLVVKGAGIVLGLIIFIGGAISQRGSLMLGSIISAIVVGGIFYFIGVAIATQGQTLLAILDLAVSSSPFLDEREKAKAMGLT